MTQDLFDSVEAAYTALARNIHNQSGNISWDIAVAEIKIFGNMVQKKILYFDNAGTQLSPNMFPDSQICSDGSEAARYLRDDIFKQSGDMVWGLKFELTKENKFDLSYNYDPPQHVTEEDANEYYLALMARLK